MLERLAADEKMAFEERKLVWKGAIPLQLQLHNSEVTTVPPPLPSLILAPRNGYLPLLVPLVKPQFRSALPIGQDTGWFEYEGLPLKWHIPIGVLFDLLCFEPTQPWNLTVHFRGFPSELLPCEGDDAMKWSFINSLKEASYVMYGSTKHVMNLSQSDQVDLWRSVVQGDLESYDRVCFRLAPSLGTSSSTGRPSSKNLGDSELATSKPRIGVAETSPLKIPFRLYVRTIKVEDGDLLEGPPVKSWDDIAYITRPVDVWREDGVVLTLWEALVKIAPQLFKRASEVATGDLSLPSPLIWESESFDKVANTDTNFGNEQPNYQGIKMKYPHLRVQKAHFLNGTIRIQGIEPSPDLPIDWISQNLSGPDHFVHVCILTVTDQRTKGEI